ncbi:MAG: hypothetical protein IPL49_01130 [Saprospirales bacterium]|nr:hypothetical protein [Saprospirales bacterium]
MKTSKLLMAGVAGGVTYFILGFLLYGLLLMDFFTKNATNDVSRGDGMVWWSLILGNLFVGFLLAYIFGQWASIKNFMGGLMGGAIVGFLFSGAIDFSMYGTSDLMNMTATISDILVGTIMFALTGGVVGLVLGMGKE